MSKENLQVSLGCGTILSSKQQFLQNYEQAQYYRLFETDLRLEQRCARHSQEI
jgi:hypothetical protein